MFMNAALLKTIFSETHLTHVLFKAKSYYFFIGKAFSEIFSENYEFNSTTSDDTTPSYIHSSQSIIENQFLESSNYFCVQKTWKLT